MKLARLDGQVAVVTGAARGLGAEFARELAANGAKVVLGDILSTEGICAKIKSAGGIVTGLPLDVTDPKSIAAAIDLAVDSYGGVDILVNNAAISGEDGPQAITSISSECFDKVVAVNARGVFEGIKAVIPAMRRRRGGSIINLSSGTALKGIPFILPYVASKGAIIAMTRAAARELGGDNIRVNAIAPGLIMTENVIRNGVFKGDALSANITSRCLKREGLPEDLIGALIFLASSESRFITGQTIVVDGGSVMV